MKHIGIAAAVLAAGAAWGQTPQVFVTVPGTQAYAAPPPTPAMQSLDASAGNLRDSIQALQQQPPTQARNAALASARDALTQTQLAMANTRQAGSYPPGTTTLGAGPQQATRELACTPSGELWVCR
jgi:hypothetical protein